ncbi:MAG TPA: EAL domain-containing protein [Thermoanaerobaculia bacterium]|nr:EAL domain-containing protein [Thermoanaerobaculia bacterium]
MTAALVIGVALFAIATRFSRTSIAMCSVAAAVAVWQVARVFMDLATDAHTALIWARIGCAALPLIAPAVYQFVSTILESTSRRRIVSTIGWLLAAEFAVLALTSGYLINGVRRFTWGFYPVYNFAAELLYPLFCGSLFIAAFVEIVFAQSSAAEIERRRMRLFAIAIGAGCLAFVDLLPAYGVPIYPLGWIAVVASTAITFYAINKFGLEVVPALPAAEIISTMRDLLLVSDRDGRIQFANNAACAFLGCAREDIIGCQLEDLLFPMDRDEAAPLQGWVRDREYVFRTKMGQPIELTLSHSPITRDGEVTGSIIIGRDLRERKRYEWEARRAVTLLQSTLDSTADGILVIGQDGRALTWNQRFADLWGIPAESIEAEDDHELIGQLVEQLVNPAEFLNTLAALHEHPEDESVHVLELKDGRRLEQYSMGRYLDDEPVRVWSFRDVTARLTAEEALRDSETRYRLLFEQNAAGVCLATVAGRIVDCNATFGEIIGYAPDELSNRELHDLLQRPEALDEVRAKLEHTPTLRGVEFEMRRRDGAHIFILANISLLGHGDSGLLHVTGVDISDRKRAQQQVEFQAYHDALTHLPNRRLFLERLELHLAAARRARTGVAVLFVDLDRFKAINDTFGHQVADALLVDVAQRLRGCVRQTDTVARHGGDEFTIIIPDLHQGEDAAQIAEKILERIVEPVTVGAASIEISVSIGIAVYPFDGTDIDSLLRNADAAMYRAKQAGRNNYQLCTDQMKERAMERSSMQSRLRKAMENGELALAYEPQVSLATGAITGAEAIIRWTDPQRGVVEPRDFIALAEDTRLIVPLGEWVLFTAARQLRQWRDAGLPSVRLAVNISSRQFQQRDLAGVVRRAVDDGRIDAARLELEIREATAMRDLELTITLLKPLRDTGVSIAIDDFGSAYSSLGSLRTLPIDAVKMDRTLTANVTTIEADASIVSAVIGVSHRLHLRVSADGVETREQCTFLREHRCDEAQGPQMRAIVDGSRFAAMAAVND